MVLIIKYQFLIGILGSWGVKCVAGGGGDRGGSSDWGEFVEGKVA